MFFIATEIVVKESNDDKNHQRNHGKAKYGKTQVNQNGTKIHGMTNHGKYTGFDNHEFFSLFLKHFLMGSLSKIPSNNYEGKKHHNTEIPKNDLLPRTGNFCILKQTQICNF